MGSSSLSLEGDCYGLTDKQRKFVAEYTIDYNSTRAAKAAGYKCASVAGHKLTSGKHYPKVARAIGRIQERNLSEAILSKEEIIKELSLIAMRDPIDLCDENGVIVIDDMRKIPPYIRRAIDGIKIKTFTDYETGDTRQEFEIKLVGKATVFRMLMEHFGMFAPHQHEIDVRVGLDWEKLFNETQEDIDTIEGEIKSVRKRSLEQLENQDSTDD